MIAVLIAVVLLAGLTAAILGLGNSSTKEVDTAQRELRSHYLAQAGVSESVVSLIENLNANLAPPAGVGSQAAPQHVQGGAYWTRIIDNGDETFSILSNGTADAGKTSLEVVVRKTGSGPFANAVFAGNTSNDPTYLMEFGGEGAEGDEIYGNVFSGNDVEVSGNAVVSGMISATGTITGASGQTGVSEAVPNLIYGDPVFGTLEHMEAFMYAEDTFYDNNLDESGSTEVTLYGNMSAGNHVDINRDNETHHTKLTVRFDSRIVQGSLVMPGLPPQFVGAPGFVTVSWREIAAP